MKWSDVPEWARSRRKDLGLTQGQVAEKAEALRRGAGGPKPIKQQQIGQLENAMLKGEPDWFRFAKVVLEEPPAAIPRDHLAGSEGGRDAREIGNRLRLAREAMRRKAPDMCIKAEIPLETYSKWENGERRPDLEEARRLRVHFGYTLDWIFEGDPSGLPPKLATRIAELEADSDPEPPHEAAQFGKPRGRPKHAKN